MGKCDDMFLQYYMILSSHTVCSIGLGIAKRLARDGCSVMINSRKQENVDKALKEMRDEGLTKVAGFSGDVSQAQQRELLLQETVKQFGGLHFLVPNAGVALAPGPLFNVSEAKSQGRTSFKIEITLTGERGAMG